MFSGGSKPSATGHRWRRPRQSPNGQTSITVRIDYQSIVYYSAPRQKPGLKSLSNLDPEIRRTYEKLGIPLAGQERLAGVAVDAVFDSVSVATTFKEKLAELGVLFCSFFEAVEKYPDLIQEYLGSIVPYTDNFFAALLRRKSSRK
jgi:Fe-S cluster assembly protein SufB